MQRRRQPVFKAAASSYSWTPSTRRPPQTSGGPTYQGCERPSLAGRTSPLPFHAADTYLDVIDDGTERARYVATTHPGFAGRELEATQRYFNHYQLEAPRIPLLVPEFTLPLFLRMYCESVQGLGQAAPQGHEGRIAIFQRYLEVKIKRVGQRLRPNSASSHEVASAAQKANGVIDALARRICYHWQRSGLTRTCGGTRSMPRSTAMRDDATVVLGALQNEGVLSRELLYLGRDLTEDGVRIVFQAFADFLILRRRIDRSSSPLEDDGLRSWLEHDASWGIGEAAALLLPERYHVELPDYLGYTDEDHLYDGEDLELRQLRGRARIACEAVVRMLPYRDSTSLDDRSRKLLNRALGFLGWSDVFGVLFQMAPQPDNFMNGELLHRHLAGIPMPERDAHFGFATYRARSGRTAAQSRRSHAGQATVPTGSTTGV